MSNYPAGVTGHEPEIAGWHEVEEDHYCDNEQCEEVGVWHTVTVFSRYARSEEGHWECQTCLTEYTVDRGPDPDEAHDRDW